MDKALWHSRLFGSHQQGLQVGDVAVHTTITHLAERDRSREKIER